MQVVEPRRAAPSLSPVQSEIVGLVLAGLPSASIAARRGRSRRTIENQLGAVYRKLGLGSRLELYARFAAGRATPVDPPCAGECRARLGEREWRAALLAARGESNKAIGWALGLAPSTVAGVLKGAWTKLGLGSRRELIHRLGGAASGVEGGGAPRPM